MNPFKRIDQLTKEKRSMEIAALKLADDYDALKSELARVQAELAECRTAEAAVVKDSFRTEPRKTPRTDAAFEHHIASVNRDTCGFSDHARALEIETQELAEALESAAELAEGAVKLLRQLDMESGRVAAECVLRDARAALASHRAKQEGPTHD